MKTDTPQTIYLKDYQPSNYLVETIDLSFDLYEDKTLVVSTSKFKINSRVENNSKQIELNGEDLELKSFQINGEDFSNYTIENEKLTFIAPEDSFTLEIETIIHPEKNTSLMGLYQSGGIFCTQCEAQGFRKITYYYDRPDVLATFSTKISADKKYKYLLSNGNLVDSGNEGKRHWALWRDPHPKPCYLFALVAGDFDLKKGKYTTTSGRKVALEIYVDKGNLKQTDHAMQSLIDSMKWDEDRFGLEYDLDIYMIVAVDSFNMGAMENKGLNVFNSKYILGNIETATDMDFYNIQAIIGHEYFHNWTGNRITCRDWFQLTLKEGLTVFRDREFSSDLNSRSVKRIDDTQNLRASQFPEDNGPLTHPIKPKSYIKMDNFYTSTVYEKGAEVIGMIFSIIGKDKFREGMDKYFELFDGQAVTTEDFVHAMELVSGYDFTHFKKWYDLSGTPQIHISSLVKEGKTHYEIEQSFLDKKEGILEIPLRFKVLNTNSDVSLQAGKSEIKDDLLIMRDKKVSLIVDEKDENFLSINRGFSAPVTVHQTLSDEQRLRVVDIEDDSFNKWDGGQEIFKKTLLSMALDKGEMSADISQLIEKTLLNTKLDNHFKGVFIDLPSLTELNEIPKNYRFQDIESAAEEFRFLVNLDLENLFKTQYLSLEKLNKKKWNAQLMGLRDLKNTLLHYLATNVENEDLIYSQFKNSKTMTDKLFALKILNKYSLPKAKAANSAFDKMCKKYPQLYPNLFTAKVMSLEGSIDNLKEVFTLKGYDKKIPNHIYSSLGRYIAGSLADCYDPSSKSFSYITDRIIEIDGYNPQVASRMIRAIKNPKKFQPGHGDKFKSEIKKIVNFKGLSKDSFEIASKLLQ